MKTSKRTLVTAISIAICSTILSCASTDKSASAGVSSNCQNERCLELGGSLIRKTEGLSNLNSDSDWETAAEYVNNCECWVKTNHFSNNFNKRLFDGLQIPLREWQAKKESANEINQLIENSNGDISIVLNKCNEYQSKYVEIHKNCKHIQDSIQNAMNFTQDSMTYQQAKPEIEALLKANKLEECFDKCRQLGGQFKTDKFKNNEELISLCGDQLVGKIKKLPVKQIKTVEFAEIYYQDTKTEHIAAKMFHNYGNIVLAETIGYNKNVTIQISGSIGCDFKNSDYIVGYAKYIGMKSLTIYGSVPHYELLWCGR